ncbi:IS3 family transposase [Burkholderia cenocepacia]|nr:IS3 family transposase [Burkholderia cenocepacia]MBJ9672458.1 IS3 family transposase [Burkholderia cenocepacia]MBJ9732952.1 IS3 family transposase [Burkholderia cenocepacia]MBR8311538.1 IS3 family transposase [Burkholderia cenocepacia]MDR8039847.1 IS3 family transposase [Burkholderia cenocepacia]MDR8059959.1 IS3 family transposase [Burkholderia cenocepacia]
MSAVSISCRRYMPRLPGSSRRQNSACLSDIPTSRKSRGSRRSDPEQWSARARRDAELKARNRTAWDENFGVYSVRKVWCRLLRDGVKVANCTIARLMKAMRLEGVPRGRRIKTSQRNDAMSCPLDRVKRQFQADRPDAFWRGRVFVCLDVVTLRLRCFRARCVRTPYRRLACVGIDTE